MKNLHALIASGSVEEVRAALASGANPNGKDERGLTPLHQAVLFRRKEMIPLIVQYGGDLTAKNDEGHDAFDTAACGDDVEILDALVDARTKKRA